MLALEGQDGVRNFLGGMKRDLTSLLLLWWGVVRKMGIREGNKR